MFRRTSVVITTTPASRVDGVVAGEQPHPIAAVGAHQIGVLLVRQRLDGRRVERSPALSERPGHGVFGHHRLAGPGGRRYQDVVPEVDRREGLALESVEGERLVGHCPDGTSAGARRRTMTRPIRIEIS